ncbi:hypothetical protein [Okeania sp. SIO1I7]|nr:hypothetical protein [Okeania sp. SIO1I7]
METRSSNKSLKSNPFQVYRDPTTGRWVVVKSDQKSMKKKAA